MSSPAIKNVPPLHALAAFEAVARLQSFARAADELCVTHGAVSHRIKTLERHFGVRLLMRRGGKVALTTKGTYFLTAVLDALAILQDASTRLAETRPVVTISAGPSSAHNWLVERLNDFYRAHPDIDLEINAAQLTPQKRRASLESGEADVAIRYGLAEDWSGLEAIKLMEVTLFPVCSPQYFESLGGLAHVRDLGKAVLLRLPREPWKPWFEAAGLDWDEPASGPLFGDASLMLDAATKGQGIALARSVLVEGDLASGRLLKPFEVSVPSQRAYYAVWSPANSVRPEVQAILDWLVGSSRRLDPAGGPSPRKTMEAVTPS